MAPSLTPRAPGVRARTSELVDRKRRTCTERRTISGSRLRRAQPEIIRSCIRLSHRKASRRGCACPRRRRRASLGEKSAVFPLQKAACGSDRRARDGASPRVRARPRRGDLVLLVVILHECVALEPSRAAPRSAHRVRLGAAEMALPMAKALADHPQLTTLKLERNALGHRARGRWRTLIRSSKEMSGKTARRRGARAALAAAAGGEGARIAVDRPERGRAARREGAPADALPRSAALRELDLSWNWVGSVGAHGCRGAAQLGAHLARARLELGVGLGAGGGRRGVTVCVRNAPAAARRRARSTRRAAAAKGGSARCATCPSDGGARPRKNSVGSHPTPGSSSASSSPRCTQSTSGRRRSEKSVDAVSSTAGCAPWRVACVPHRRPLAASASRAQPRDDAAASSSNLPTRPLARFPPLSLGPQQRGRLVRWKINCSRDAAPRWCRWWPRRGSAIPAHAASCRSPHRRTACASRVTATAVTAALSRGRRPRRQPVAARGRARGGGAAAMGIDDIIRGRQKGGAGGGSAASPPASTPTSSASTPSASQNFNERRVSDGRRARTPTCWPQTPEKKEAQLGRHARTAAAMPARRARARQALPPAALIGPCESVAVYELVRESAKCRCEEYVP